MTTEEMSNEFDTYVSSYRRFKDFDKQEELDSIEFNEYEKSVFLTQAQEDLVVELYNGKNVEGVSFESSEELRRYLSGLVKTATLDSTTGIGISNKSVFYSLPEDLWFITLERVKFNDESLGCANGSEAQVYPTTQDNYQRTIRNPFKGPNKRRVLRLDSGGNTVELISNYEIGEYIIRYLSKLEPIILVDLTSSDLTINEIAEVTPCKLHETLHRVIVERAVRIALATKIQTKDKNN